MTILCDDDKIARLRVYMQSEHDAIVLVTVTRAKRKVSEARTPSCFAVCISENKDVFSKRPLFPTFWCQKVEYSAHLYYFPFELCNYLLNILV